jgi:hypothetical protein
MTEVLNFYALFADAVSRAGGRISVPSELLDSGGHGREGVCSITQVMIGGSARRGSAGLRKRRSDVVLWS